MVSLWRRKRIGSFKHTCDCWCDQLELIIFFLLRHLCLEEIWTTNWGVPQSCHCGPFVSVLCGHVRAHPRNWVAPVCKQWCDLATAGYLKTASSITSHNFQGCLAPGVCHHSRAFGRSGVNCRCLCSLQKLCDPSLLSWGYVASGLPRWNRFLPQTVILTDGRLLEKLKYG